MSPNLERTIDPELASALAALPKGPNGKLMDLHDIPGMRAQQSAMAGAMADRFPVPPDVSIQILGVARPDGTDLDLQMYRPAGSAAASPALAYFHPGGQVFGEGLRQDGPMAAMALALGCVVIGVDYRVAPETPAPGAAEDGLLAFTYLVDHAAELGIDPGRIGIAAASGGGAPAVATALMLRDRDLQRPCLLALSYPMLDDRNETPSSHEITDIGIWDREENEIAWKAVLGEQYGSLDLDPYCAPGRATDLGNLPRAFVAVGQLDVFRDESIDFARRLIAAGVPTDLHVYGTAFHSFDLMAPETALARELNATWQTFVRRELHA